jgi:SAM-dependent methyltransferase
MSLASVTSSLLSHPRAYLLTQYVLGGMHARKLVIRDFVRPGPGLRVLDVGCGPAYTARYFPAPEYYGFDISPRYIAFANQRYGSRGRFIAGAFDESALGSVPPVDAVLMLGLLHHLDDQSAAGLLRLAKRAMKPGARLFTLDGFYEAGQHPIARFLLDRDRGKFIRTREAYLALARTAFDDVKASSRDGMFFLPYPSLVLECRR